MAYQTNSQCKVLIALHLILVVKYRKQLLQGDFVKLKIIEIASCSEFDVEEIEVDKDHIHILLTISPTICAARYIRRIKQSSTQSLWGKFGWLKKQFWREKLLVWRILCLFSRKCIRGNSSQIHSRTRLVYRFIPPTPFCVDQWVFSTDSIKLVIRLYVVFLNMNTWLIQNEF